MIDLHQSLIVLVPGVRLDMDGHCSTITKLKTTALPSPLWRAGGLVAKYLKEFCILVGRTLGLFCLVLGTMILLSRMLRLRPSIGSTGFR